MRISSALFSLPSPPGLQIMYMFHLLKLPPQFLNVLSSFYRPIIKFMNSFLGHVECPDEPAKSIFHPIAVLWISSISFKPMEFPALFTLPIYSFWLSGFSIRNFSILILVILNSLSDHSNVCISESDAYFFSSDCFSCLLACKFLLKSRPDVLSNKSKLRSL